MRPGQPARSIWFSKPGQLVYREELLKPLQEEQVLIKTLFSGISQGTEMLVYRGEVPADTPFDLEGMEGSFTFPIKYGYCNLGEVVELGPKANRLRIGDKVFLHAPHQTFYSVSQDAAMVMPEEVPLKRAVFFASLETAITALWDAELNLGERVAVFGQGVIGLLLTMLFRHCGALDIITLDKYDLRRQLSLEMGASLSLDPDNPATWEAISPGMDLVVEASGDPGALEYCIKLIGTEGTILVVSWYGIKAAKLMLGNNFHRNRLTIKSSQVSRLPARLSARWDRRRRAELVWRLISQYPLENLITHTYPFSNAAEAYRLLEERPQQAVQVILDYAGD